MCGIQVHVQEGRAIKVEGDPEDHLSKGHICPKAMGLIDLEDDPDRLTRPLMRKHKGAEFEEVDWETAFDFAAKRLNAIKKKFGNNAVGLYQGNPTVHSLGALTHGQFFVRALGTRNRYSATSADQLPHMLAALQMFGHQFAIAIPDIDRTAHFVILGANPLASNGSLMSAPGMRKRLAAVQARGGKVVVIDPRRTETAEVADEHHFIRPGQDALLLAAMTQQLFAKDRVALGRLETLIDADDVKALRSVTAAFTPERVAPHIGIAAEEIARMTTEFADATSAVLYPRFGACTNAFGGLTLYLANAINLLTGNCDRAGGAMFTLPAVDVVGMTAKAKDFGHFDKGRSRVRNLPEFGGEYPVSTLADEILTPGEGQIRALVTSAGNPVLSAPSGHALDMALGELDFMLSLDFYLNETTRHADVILPPTPALQRDHYDFIFHVLAVRNTARWAPAAVQKPAHAKHDWEIFLELASRLEKRPLNAPGRVMRTLGKQATPKRLIRLALKAGPHSVRMKDLVTSPEGVDLGPLTPQLPERLFTQDGRIHLAPPLYLGDFARLEASVDAPAPELVLIGRRQLRSNNSWMHNCRRLAKGKDRCTVLMHSDDAKARDLTHGSSVVVRSQVGELTLPLEVTDAMMPGVISIPHGFGHHRAQTRLSVASKKPGASVNDITSSTRIDPLSGNAAFSGEPVEVEAAPA